MAFGNVAREFEETKGTMFAPMQPNLEKIELAGPTTVNQAVSWDSENVKPAIQAPEVKSANTAPVSSLPGDAALAGSSLRDISGVKPSSSDALYLGREMGKELGEFGKELFSFLGSKAEEPAVAQDGGQQLASIQHQQKYVQPFGI